MIHVYPEWEEAQHVLEGTQCPCGVDIDWSESEAVITHHCGRILAIEEGGV